MHSFQNAEEALESCAAIAAGESTEKLRNFLEQNLPKKKKRCQLGILGKKGRRYRGGMKRLETQSSGDFEIFLDRIEPLDRSLTFFFVIVIHELFRSRFG